MFYAKSENGEKIEATQKGIGFCPSCEERLQPKCGNLVPWHWSHMGRRDCDVWYEPETEWHLGWKRLFGKENCEVVIPPRRADIKGNFDVVIELQHSSISVDEIAEREQFYKKMIWLVDAHEFADNLQFFKSSGNEFRRIWSSEDIRWKNADCHFNLYWKHVRKCWTPMHGARSPVLLDLSQTQGKGRFQSKTAFNRGQVRKKGTDFGKIQTFA